MMTYPGAPMLYYGDEIGLEGGRDPDCRRAMLWDQSRWNHDLLAAVKRYIALRKHYAAVWRGGAYARLYAQGMVYVFARQRDRQTVVVGLNAGTREAKLDLDVHRLFPRWGPRARRVEWSAVHGDRRLCARSQHPRTRWLCMGRGEAVLMPYSNQWR